MMSWLSLHPTDAAAVLTSFVGVVAFLLWVAEQGSMEDLHKAIAIAQIAIKRYGLTLG